MTNFSSYKVVKHSKDERLNCFGWTCYCDYYSIYDGDAEIGQIYEDGGDVFFRGKYKDFSTNNRANRIELQAVYDDKVQIYEICTGKTYLIEA